jgi:hypothetical protein
MHGTITEIGWKMWKSGKGVIGKGVRVIFQELFFLKNHSDPFSWAGVNRP